MSRDSFLDECRESWVAAMEQALGAHPPLSARWENPTAIIAILQTLVTEAKPHIHLPDGGGFDAKAVRLSARERGMIEFQTSSRAVYLAKPETLKIEYFPNEPAQSFAMLTLATIKDSGTYEHKPRFRQEELVDLTGHGEYVERRYWDEGVYDGDELPDDAKLVIRYLGGSFFFVTKGSIWNGMSQTYDGVHDKHSAEELRAIIDTAISRRP